MTTTPPPPLPSAAPPPALPPAERVRAAYVDRPNSDYVFEGKGMVIFLTIITCGIFGFYVFYQLMRRMRDHNRRRLELLEGATEFAWQQASEQGIAEELRPNFERISGHLAVLRQMTGDFRDPAIWLVISIFASSIAIIVAFVFLDGDLIKHDTNEGAVEAELVLIYGRLGQPLPAPDPGRVKGKQNYAGRIIATIGSCGIYYFWWLYDQMVDVDNHFAHNWPWEDALAGAVQQMSAAA
jgi:Domain of unknown function (DUF4234)